MSFVSTIYDPSFYCSICCTNELKEGIVGHNDHKFHKNCLQNRIQKCFEDNVEPRCPLCKKKIIKINENPVRNLQDAQVEELIRRDKAMKEFLEKAYTQENKELEFEKIMYDKESETVYSLRYRNSDKRIFLIIEEK